MVAQINEITDVSATEEDGQLKSVTRAFQIVEHVKVTSLAKEVLALSALPKYQDAYDGDTNIICVSITI